MQICLIFTGLDYITVETRRCSTNDFPIRKEPLAVPVAVPVKTNCAVSGKTTQVSFTPLTMLPCKATLTHEVQDIHTVHTHTLTEACR